MHTHDLVIATSATVNAQQSTLNCQRIPSEHEADRAGIPARRYEMRSRKCGMKVVERDFVGQIGNREVKSHVSVVGLIEQIVRAESEIEQIAWRDA